MIAHWHTDADYLDRHGRPLPLPLNGELPSLEHLVRRVYPTAELSVVVRALLHTGAIRRKGDRFRSVKRHVIFRGPIAGRMHALSALMGLLRTVEHNMTHPRGKILEMSASNPNVPTAELPALSRHIHRRGTDFLFEIDAALARVERRPGKSTRKQRVGVCMFLYTSTAAPNRRPNATVRA